LKVTGLSDIPHCMPRSVRRLDITTLTRAHLAGLCAADRDATLRSVAGDDAQAAGYLRDRAV